MFSAGHTCTIVTSICSRDPKSNAQSNAPLNAQWGRWIAINSSTTKAKRALAKRTTLKWIKGYRNLLSSYKRHKKDPWNYIIERFLRYLADKLIWSKDRILYPKHSIHDHKNKGHQNLINSWQCRKKYIYSSWKP